MTASAVSVAEVLAKHAKSYNTDRSGVGYVVCRCGLVIELDGASGADDARTFAEHQAEELSAASYAPAPTPAHAPIYPLGKIEDKR